MKRLSRFLESLSSYGSRSCIEGDGGACTYAELISEVARWQGRLDTLRVSSGSVVALRSDYSVASTSALIALFTRGVIVAMIPRDRAVEPYVADAHAAVFLDIAADGSHQCELLSAVPSHFLLERLRATGEGGVLMFTSGSTGRPKAALQSVERFLYKFEKPGRSLRTLAFLLLDHVAGLDTLFYTLASGGTLIFPRRRDPQSILQLIDAYKVEVLPTSPSFLRLLCAAKGARSYDLSSLRVITYGSEPMDPSTLARINDRFPNAQISQKYGTTETGSPRTVSRANDSLWLKIKSDGVETKVDNGVLWIRSEGTILGYLNAPSPVDEQGWYCTGDLVEVDGEWIRFCGRTADIIKVGGEKVAPVEVEQVILELGFVRDVVVLGEPHALMGQVVAARVSVADTGMDAKDIMQCIRAHCRQRLSAHQVPIKIEIVAGGLASDRQKLQRRHSPQ